MDIKRKKNLKGVSLIELLLYLAIFGIIFIVLVQFFFFISDSNRYANEALKIDRATIYITQHFKDVFDQADGLDEINSDFLVDDGVLILTDGGTDLTYSLVSERLQYNDGSNSNFISRVDTSVTSLYLETIDDRDDNVIGIRVTIELEASADANLTKTVTNSYFID